MIVRWEYAAGSAGSTVLILMAMRGAPVARAVIERSRRAARALRRDGLIRTEPGMGSFVTTPEERREMGVERAAAPQAE
ncbi:hypothetical protein BKM31_51575 [[Actinomadura] parvosata subsp. kistnae]|uniref:Uncharacterized protein n=1 Tax=[Actinomadura] parvosata subsp. kistnae TaxID=1909395 RepID=A0A1V0AF32_9ACTN|nr:hypothetical protein BKM31_51575 [Nonomuraea sp. ATCC 55076]